MNYNLEFIRTGFTKVEHLISELTELRERAVFIMGVYAEEQQRCKTSPSPLSPEPAPLIPANTQDRSSFHIPKERRMQLDTKGVSINS